MKALFFLLMLANVCFAAYYLLDQWGDAHPDPMHTPLNAEKVRVLNPQQVAALGPAKAQQLNLTCAEWGPFNEQERAAAQAALDPLQLGKTLSTKSVEVSAANWVFIPAKANKAAMDKAIDDLKRLGVSDYAAISEGGSYQWAISLGTFRNEAAARARLAEVEKAGVKTALVIERAQTLQQTVFQVREPQQATVSGLEALKSKFPWAELKISTCPERNS